MPESPDTTITFIQIGGTNIVVPCLSFNIDMKTIVHSSFSIENEILFQNYKQKMRGLYQARLLRTDSKESLPVDDDYLPFIDEYRGRSHCTASTRELIEKIIQLSIREETAEPSPNLIWNFEEFE